MHRNKTRKYKKLRKKKTRRKRGGQPPILIPTKRKKVIWTKHGEQQIGKEIIIQRAWNIFKQTLLDQKNNWFPLTNSLDEHNMRGDIIYIKIIDIDNIWGMPWVYMMTKKHLLDSINKNLDYIIIIDDVKSTGKKVHRFHGDGKPYLAERYTFNKHLITPLEPEILEKKLKNKPSMLSEKDVKDILDNRRHYRFGVNGSQFILMKSNPNRSNKNDHLIEDRDIMMQVQYDKMEAQRKAFMEEEKRKYEEIQKKIEAKKRKTHKKGGKRRKKTRKKRGGWRRIDIDFNKDDIGYYYDCWNRDGNYDDVKYREGMTITGWWDVLNGKREWKILEMLDSDRYDPNLILYDDSRADFGAFRIPAQQLCTRGFKPLKKNQAKTGAGSKKKTRRKRGGVKTNKNMTSKETHKILFSDMEKRWKKNNRKILSQQNESFKKYTKKRNAKFISEFVKNFKHQPNDDDKKLFTIILKYLSKKKLNDSENNFINYYKSKKENKLKFIYMNNQIRQMLRETANEKKKIFHNVYDNPQNLKKLAENQKLLKISDKDGFKFINKNPSERRSPIEFITIPDKQKKDDPEETEKIFKTYAKYTGGRKKRRKKRGGYNELPPIRLNKQEFIDMVQSDPDKSYKIMRNVRFDGMDDIDDPEYGYNKWYTGKIKYKEFNEDFNEDTFIFDIYDADGDYITGWEDSYLALTDGPDTGALDYEWTSVRDSGRDIIFRGGRKKRKNKKKTRKKRGGHYRKEICKQLLYKLENRYRQIELGIDVNNNIKECKSTLKILKKCTEEGFISLNEYKNIQLKIDKLFQQYGGKRRKRTRKRTRKKRGNGGVFSRPLRVRPFVPEEQGENNTVDTFVSESDNQDDGENLPVATPLYLGNEYDNGERDEGMLRLERDRDRTMEQRNRRNNNTRREPTVMRSYTENLRIAQEQERQQRQHQNLNERVNRAWDTEQIRTNQRNNNYYRNSAHDRIMNQINRHRNRY